MINQVYQLIAPQRLDVHFEELSLDTDNVIVRPEYLSICAADQRYFTGQRDKRTLKQKLPMALIHEAWGTVVYDRLGEHKPGDKVLLIPNTPIITDEYIRENYLRSSKFRASGFDGFMQEYVCMERDRIYPFTNIRPEVAAICELISVAMHSVDTFLSSAHGRRDVIGVWGDGNLGFITSLLLSQMLPESKVYSFGVHQEKLEYFSFSEKTFLTYDLNPSDNIAIDHAFECVGGSRCEPAIDQIIDFINPEGTIMLLGVSENNVPIKTRMVLEKGLKLIGRSRSGREDFIKTANFLSAHKDIQQRLKNIIREVIIVRELADVTRAFEEDIHQPFKTVMKWDI